MTDRFLERIRHAYDSSFSYRLLYNLRNYAQHHDAPISMINVHLSKSDNEKYISSVRYVIDPIKISESPLIQKSFLNQLQCRGESQLDLIDLSKNNQICFEYILRFVFEENLEKLAKMKNYMTVVLNKTKLPKGATPVIFEGEFNPSSNSHSGTYYHFSFDELRFFAEIFHRIAAQPAAE